MKRVRPTLILQRGLIQQGMDAARSGATKPGLAVVHIYRDKGSAQTKLREGEFCLNYFGTVWAYEVL